MLIKLLKIIFETIFAITNESVLSIVIYSILISIVVNYIKSKTNKFVKQEEVLQKILNRKIKSINSNDCSRKEKHLMVKRLYAKYSYNPIFRLRILIPLLVQIPFLIGTYILFNRIDFNVKYNALGIVNLNAEDGLLSGFNLFPVIIFVINLVMLFLIREQSKKQKSFSFLISFLFLILIYNEKSALLIFWGISNMFLFLISFVNESVLIKIKSGIKIRNIFVLNSLLFVSLLIIPIHIYALKENENINNLTFHLAFNLLVYFIVFILAYIIDFLLSKILKSELIFKLIRIILLTLTAWFTLSGLFFPIIQKTGGLTNISESPLDVFNFLIVLILSTFSVVVYHFEKFKIYFKISFFIIVLSTLFVSLKTIKINFEKKVSNELEILKFSKEKNIIVLSFDGVPGNIVNEILLKDKNRFKDFILYENTLSTGPTTFSSMVTELFGNIDLKKISINKKDLLKKIPLKKHIINAETSEDVSISTFGDYKSFRTNLSNHFDYIMTEGETINKISNSLFILEIELARIFSAKSSIYLNKLIWVISNKLSSLDLFNDPLLNHKGPSWDKEMISHKKDFENLVNFAYKSDEKLTIKYMHFAFTHFPVDFDKNGKYQSNNKIWHDSNQNYSGLYNQTVFAVDKMEDFINKLKEIGVYQNSTIILKSDHGEPPNYFNNYPDNLKINNHKILGYNRYRPFLLIKKDHNNFMRVDSSVISLGDLSKTVINLAKIGEDISHNSYDIIGEKNYKSYKKLYLLIPKNENSNQGYNSYKSIEVNRKNVLINSLKENLVEIN